MFCTISSVCEWFTCTIRGCFVIQTAAPRPPRYSPCLTDTILPLIREFRSAQEAHGRPTAGLDDLLRAFEMVDQSEPGLSENLVAEIIRKLGGSVLNANQLAQASARVTG